MNLHDRDNFRRWLKEGITQGAEQKAIETAKNLFSMSLSIEQIAKATGLSVEYLKTLK
jgi:predicted transposase/invertase (TIGR01784 family)